MTTQPPAPVPYIAPALAVVANAHVPGALAWAPMSTAPPKKRLVQSHTGHQKTGKTHYSLATTPEPVYYANIDIGTEGVSHKMAGRNIQEVVVRYEKGWPQDEYKRLWGQLDVLYKDALASNAGTLVIDSETENWELEMLAEFGRTTEIMPRTRGVLNSDKRAFINACLSSDMNIIFCSRVRPIWVNNENTGGFERRGYNGLDYDCQVVSWAVKRQPKDPLGNVIGDTEFGIWVQDSRLNPAMEGKYYWGHECRFDWMVELSWQK